MGNENLNVERRSLENKEKILAFVAAVNEKMVKSALAGEWSVWAGIIVAGPNEAPRLDEVFIAGTVKDTALAAQAKFLASVKELDVAAKQ